MYERSLTELDNMGTQNKRHQLSTHQMNVDRDLERQLVSFRSRVQVIDGIFCSFRLLIRKQINFAFCG